VPLYFEADLAHRPRKTYAWNVAHFADRGCSFDLTCAVTVVDLPHPIIGGPAILQFLGQRVDEPIGEVTKQDVVAFRHSLVGQVSAKNVNHDLRALRFKYSATVAIGLQLMVDLWWLETGRVTAQVPALGAYSQAHSYNPSDFGAKKPLKVGKKSFRNFPGGLR
jgi:hypothetical protein